MSGDNETPPAPAAPEPVSEEEGWISSHQPAKVEPFWSWFIEKCLPFSNTTRCFRTGSVVARGNGGKSGWGMAFEKILVGYVRTSLVERPMLQRRRRPSADWNLWAASLSQYSTYLCISIDPLFRAANLFYVSYDQMPKSFSWSDRKTTFLHKRFWCQKKLLKDWFLPERNDAKTCFRALKPNAKPCKKR